MASHDDIQPGYRRAAYAVGAVGLMLILAGILLAVSRFDSRPEFGRSAAPAASRAAGSQAGGGE